jgi:hypothetical protein
MARSLHSRFLGNIHNKKAFLGRKFFQYLWGQNDTNEKLLQFDWHYFRFCLILIQHSGHPLCDALFFFKWWQTQFQTLPNVQSPLLILQRRLCNSILAVLTHFTVALRHDQYLLEITFHYLTELLDKQSHHLLRRNFFVFPFAYERIFGKTFVFHDFQPLRTFDLLLTYQGERG